MSTHKIKRVGFDTIITAHKTRLSSELCGKLVEAREQARQKRSPEPIELGPDRVAGEVLPHGVQGGYDVVFSTGDLGALVQFKTDQKGDEWAVRSKIRAASLLVHGYPGAVQLALERLGGILGGTPTTHLSEVHICVDVLTSAEFRLDEKRLLRPGRAHVQPYETFDEDHPWWTDKEFCDSDIRRILCGTRLQTVMIGSHATGSQTVIYNKRDEAALRRNNLFFEAYDLDRHDRSWSLWRFEPRFSGEVLKHHPFQVRSFADLENKAQDMLDWATRRLRYNAPGQERMHPQRRHLDPFWQAIRNAIPTLSAVQPSIILPSVALDILIREKRQALENSAVGAMVAIEAMSGASMEMIMQLLPANAFALLRRKLRQTPDKIRDRIVRAVERNRVQQKTGVV